MEAHHHSNFNHKTKKWKEYFLEFLMIFLAVTLGFFAESFRENLTNNHKEKEYIRSMVEDLQKDATFLQLSINKLIPYHLVWLDSTMNLFRAPSLKGKDRKIYQAFMVATGWTYNFHPTERTLTQLRSEGYHLIRNKNAAATIIQLETEYKFQAQTLTSVENLQNDIDLSAYTFADRVVTDQIATTAFKHFSDSSSVDLELSDVPETATIDTTNKEAIKLYVDKLKKYSFYLQYGIKGWDIILLKAITDAIVVLNKEYGF
jgi:hypothetical protein